MIFDHNATALHEVIGITKADLDYYFENTMWKNFETVKNGIDVSDEVLAQMLVHLVGVYNEYDRIIIPILGSIYGFRSNEFKDITNMEVSRQLESIVKFSDKQLRKFIGGYYVMTLLNDKDDNESTTVS